MGFSLSLFFFLASLPGILAQQVTHATITVDGTVTMAKTDDNFVCATLDWWPHDKCNYNHCPWWYSSVINLVSIFKLCFLWIELAFEGFNLPFFFFF